LGYFALSSCVQFYSVFLSNEDRITCEPKIESEDNSNVPDNNKDLQLDSLQLDSLQPDPDLQHNILPSSAV
jgi:hypothetical protein